MSTNPVKLCCLCGQRQAKKRYRACHICRLGPKVLCDCGGFKQPGSIMCRPCRKERASHVATRHREFLLGDRYGITLIDYDNMLLEQNGGCKICGRHPKKYRLSIDHDHKTNKVRGLLCVSCNRALGRLEILWNEFHRYIESGVSI